MPATRCNMPPPPLNKCTACPRSRATSCCAVRPDPPRTSPTTTSIPLHHCKSEVLIHVQERGKIASPMLCPNPVHSNRTDARRGDTAPRQSTGMLIHTEYAPELKNDHSRELGGLQVRRRGNTSGGTQTRRFTPRNGELACAGTMRCQWGIACEFALGRPAAAGCVHQRLGRVISASVQAPARANTLRLRSHAPIVVSHVLAHCNYRTAPHC